MTAYTLQALCHEETFTALVRMALQRPSVQVLGLLYRLASQGPPEVQIMLEPHIADFVALAKVKALHTAARPFADACRGSSLPTGLCMSFPSLSPDAPSCLQSKGVCQDASSWRIESPEPDPHDRQPMSLTLGLLLLVMLPRHAACMHTTWPAWPDT